MEGKGEEVCFCICKIKIKKKKKMMKSPRELRRICLTAFVFSNSKFHWKKILGDNKSQFKIYMNTTFLKCGIFLSIVIGIFFLVQSKISYSFYLLSSPL